LKKIANKYGLLLIIASTLITLDQITKAILRANLAFGEFWAPWDWMIPYARIIHINNTGAAFGLFKGANPVFMVLAVIVCVAIIYYYPSISKKDWLIRTALSMQFAGAIGNLIDRIIFGKVTDFVSIGNFAVFNVADASITVGVPILLLGVWMQEKREKKIASGVVEDTQVSSGDGLSTKID
jgi:signal peptidase II